MWGTFRSESAVDVGIQPQPETRICPLPLLLEVTYLGCHRGKENQLPLLIKFGNFPSPKALPLTSLFAILSQFLLGQFTVDGGLSSATHFPSANQT